MMTKSLPMYQEKITGVILAGGLARRMGGGDKSLLTLAGKSLLQRVVERARPQVARLVLNANGDPARFETYGLPVAADMVSGFAGPLAGILTGMQWVHENSPECEWIVSFACDTPLFPEDLVVRLMQQAEQQKAPLACAVSDGRRHPVFGLWSMRLMDDLHRAVVEEDVRKIVRWTERYRCTQVSFATTPFDPFFNINHPDDLQVAKDLLNP